MRRIITLSLATVAFTLAAVGCNNRTTIDCGGRCDEAHTTCRERCTDDACRRTCDTDLENCSGQCHITTNLSSGDGGMR